MRTSQLWGDKQRRHATCSATGQIGFPSLLGLPPSVRVPVWYRAALFPIWHQAARTAAGWEADCGGGFRDQTSAGGWPPLISKG